MPYLHAEDMLDSFDYIINSLDDIRQEELLAIRKNNNKCTEYLAEKMPLEILKNGGLPWLIEPLRELQPLSFKVLEQYSSDYFVGFRWWGIFGVNDQLSVAGYIIVKDTVIVVPYSPLLGYESYKDFYPIDIQNSWLKHCAGWGVANEHMRNFMFETKHLFRGVAGTKPFTDEIKIYHPDWVKTIIPGLKGKLPHVFSEQGWNKPDHSYPLLRAVLDTREPGVQTKECDQLFIIEKSTDQLLYWVKDFDYDNIAVITNPAEALDLYSSQTLLNLDQAEMPRFDFSPWAQRL